MAGVFVSTVDRQPERLPLDIFNFLPKYLRGLWAFLNDPAQFVSEQIGTSENQLLEALGYLGVGGMLSVVPLMLNIYCYDERIRRVIRVEDKAVNYANLIAVAGVVAFVMFVIFWIFGGRASLQATILVVMYTIAFTGPLLGLVLIALTRTVSALVDVPIVVVPPAKIQIFDTLDISTASGIILRVFTGLLWCWNGYLTWVLWTVLRTVNGMGYARSAVALSLSGGLVFGLEWWLSRIVEGAVEPLRSVWPWLF